MPAKQHHIFSEATLIPISLALVLIGFAFWVASVYAQTQQNSGDIGEVKDRVNHNVDLFREMNGKIDRLEGQVQFIHDYLKDERWRPRK
jgi:hypothetical protein